MISKAIPTAKGYHLPINKAVCQCQFLAPCLDIISKHPPCLPDCMKCPESNHLVISASLPHGIQLDNAVALAARPAPAAHTRPRAENLRGTLHGVLAAQLAAEEQADSGPGCGGVDDRIPEPHQGKHDAGGIGEGEGDEVGIDEGVDAVDG